MLRLLDLLSTLLLGCLIKCVLFLIGAGMLAVVFGQLLLYGLIVSSCFPLFLLTYFQKVLKRLHSHLLRDNRFV